MCFVLSEYIISLRIIDKTNFLFQTTLIFNPELLFVNTFSIIFYFSDFLIKFWTREKSNSI